MKRWMGFAGLIALVGTLTIAVQNTPAQTRQNSAADARVKAALDKAGMKYEIDSDGDFKLVIELPSGRTQLAFVRSSTQKLNGNLEIREIISPGYKSKSAFSPEIANQLLSDSARKKLGAWQTVKSGEASIALFCSKILANSDADSLVASIQATVLSADEVEKQLTNKDDF
ncbi:hypothetical protein Q2T42_19905 [Leptolyngbya boryana CZ1]|uniref:Uncharacterized protein n=1 Tax=Leptolyngbya boryana CZ1 TaxID=3060204 RepID=A0AA96WQR2_LEPBY|nr:hypothetical protein [Leptolyngbya boryana]WNZ44097.1 hypothetical protein Q2T42_19905 [Leptolyngbya boryana CZ1]